MLDDELPASTQQLAAGDAWWCLDCGRAIAVGAPVDSRVACLFHRSALIGSFVDLMRVRWLSHRVFAGPRHRVPLSARRRPRAKAAWTWRSTCRRPVAGQVTYFCRRCAWLGPSRRSVRARTPHRRRPRLDQPGRCRWQAIEPSSLFLFGYCTEAFGVRGRATLETGRETHADNPAARVVLPGIDLIESVLHVLHVSGQ